MPKADAILALMRQRESWQAEDLGEALEISSSELNSALIMLEISGKIKRLTGANYVALD